MKSIYIILAAALLSLQTSAQEEETIIEQKIIIKEKEQNVLSVSTDGVSVYKTSKDGTPKEEKAFSVSVAMVDLGINTLRDNTVYGTTEVNNFLQVPDEVKNENLFSLRNGKSVNVNIYPVVAKWRLQKSNVHKTYLSMGAGLQMYNFRFTKNISYINEVNPAVIIDSVDFSKNKLGLTYLSVPLMLTFKTKLAEKAWLVYGAGITGGYRISSWMKQISKERGKDKNHDKFNFSDFNSCITTEIGLDGMFRLYASYQLTPLHETALDQHPLCIGIRFGGI